MALAVLCTFLSMSMNNYQKKGVNLQRVRNSLLTVLFAFWTILLDAWIVVYGNYSDHDWVSSIHGVFIVEIKALEDSQKFSGSLDYFCSQLLLQNASCTCTVLYYYLCLFLEVSM